MSKSRRSILKSLLASPIIAKAAQPNLSNAVASQAGELAQTTITTGYVDSNAAVPPQPPNRILTRRPIPDWLENAGREALVRYDQTKYYDSCTRPVTTKLRIEERKKRRLYVYMQRLRGPHYPPMFIQPKTLKDELTELNHLAQQYGIGQGGLI